MMIEEQALVRLVRVFYAQVRQDPELGPWFNDAVHDWPRHEALLVDFWSSVMTGSGRYKGNPMAAHLRHRPAMTPAHFERWLALWQAAAEQTLPPDGAEAVRATAGRIARSLQLGIQTIAA